MNEKEYTIIELPLKVPHFTTTGEVVEMCKSTTYEDGTMYLFPIQIHSENPTINWLDINKVFNVPDQWCGFVIGFRVTEEEQLVIIKVPNVPNGKLLLSLHDTKFPIYVCPIGIADNDKLIRVWAFRVCSY